MTKLRRPLMPNQFQHQVESIRRRQLNIKRAPIQVEVALVESIKKKKTKHIGLTTTIQTCIPIEFFTFDGGADIAGSSLHFSTPLNNDSIWIWVISHKISSNNPNIPTVIPDETGIFDLVDSVLIGGFDTNSRLSLFKLRTGSYDPLTSIAGATIDFGGENQDFITWGYDAAFSVGIYTAGIISSEVAQGIALSGSDVEVNELSGLNTFSCEENALYSVVGVTKLNSILPGIDYTMSGEYTATELNGMSQFKIGQGDNMVAASWDNIDYFGLINVEVNTVLL